jgi:nucleoid-associated protein YgaU
VFTLTIIIMAIVMILAYKARTYVQQERCKSSATPAGHNAKLAASFGMSEFGTDYCDRCDEESYIRRFFHQQHGWILSLCVKCDKEEKEVRNMRTFYKNNAGLIDILLAALAATLMTVGVIKLAQFVHQDPPTCVVASVTAKQGDTWWGISEEYCPDHLRTGETVSIISEMNGGTGNVRVGQVINLPFKKGGN